MKVLFLRPEGEEVKDVNIKGLEIININLFNIKCKDYEHITLREYETLAFTSKNAVKCLRDEDIDTIKSLNKVVYAIGESTANEIKRKIDENLIVKYPDKFTSRDLAYLIVSNKVKSCISFRSALADSTMHDILSKYGVLYKEVHNYEPVINYDKLDYAVKLLIGCSVDVVVFTSSLAARLLKDSVPNCVKIVSIGPVTSKELRDYNFIEAERHDIIGIIEVLNKLREGRDNA